jgi:hypothetical membrane protein
MSDIDEATGGAAVAASDPAARPTTLLDRVAILSGILGASIIALGSIATAFAYQGSKGESYSPFSHWVSELGEPGVSGLAQAFNVCLVIGGVLFALFMLGLAVTRTGRLRWLYGPLGIVAGLAGTGVGIYPMNQLDMHALVALTFFNLGWIVVGIASIDFLRAHDPRFPRWLSIIGGLTVAAFIGFLVSLQTEGLVGEDALAPPEIRRDFWIVPTLEWALIIGILAWVLLTSLAWLRAARSSA